MAARAITLALGALVALSMALGCAGATVDRDDPGTVVAEPTAASDTPTPAPVIDASGQVRTSNAVPSIEALVEIGLTESQAECFVRVIDPDDNGEIETDEQFMDAFATCVQ